MSSDDLNRRIWRAAIDRVSDRVDPDALRAATPVEVPNVRLEAALAGIHRRRYLGLGYAAAGLMVLGLSSAAVFWSGEDSRELDLARAVAVLEDYDNGSNLKAAAVRILNMSQHALDECGRRTELTRELQALLLTSFDTTAPLTRPSGSASIVQYAAESDRPDLTEREARQVVEWLGYGVQGLRAVNARAAADPRLSAEDQQVDVLVTVVLDRIRGFAEDMAVDERR